MKKIVLSTLLTATGCFVLACNGDNSQNDGGTDAAPYDAPTSDAYHADSGSGDSGSDGGIPGYPTLKTQLDRMGRPAINTALNHAFDPACTATTCPAKDTYNADSNSASWTTNATYVAQFEANLAILDGLDMVCGNQFGFTITNSYLGLSSVLLDDRLYVDTSQATCSQYLGVELKALGLTATGDCGGRMMSYSPIDVTYSAVAAGTLAGVTDGLLGPSKNVTSTTFPYLPAPF